MEEEVKEEDKVQSKPKYSLHEACRTSTIITLALLITHLHSHYVSTIYENSTHFSHLSELEREMLLYSEQGFYYSYYKTVLRERPLIVGMSHLLRDTLVEHPKEVNALNRFNIHPELIIGSIYIYLEPYINTTVYRKCHKIDRGYGLSPIDSCVGIGEPIYFYLLTMWILSGVLVAAAFLHATTLSGSILGGILTTVQYFATHKECTRVQFAPNLRENIAAPFLFLQMWCLTLLLKDQKRTSFQLQVTIFTLNCLCLLSWQFSQFVFLTQIFIFFVMEQLKIISLKTLCVFLHSHFCGLHMAVLLLQGNDMLKTSLYSSLFLVVSAYCLLFSSLRIKVKNFKDFLVESWLVFLRIALTICASIYLKKVISNYMETEEDTHIWEILYSKFTDYKSFHSLLYTCAEVYDFLPKISIFNMFDTLLFPFAILATMNVVQCWSQRAVNKTVEYYEKLMISEKHSAPKPEEENSDDSGIDNNTEMKIKDENLSEKTALLRNGEEPIKDVYMCYLKNLEVDAAMFYNIAQMFVFGVLAFLVMRLKQLFTTQMCIVSSLLLIPKYKSYPNSRVLRWVLRILSVAVIAYRLQANIAEELAIEGEFTNIPQEELLQWIRNKSISHAAFAGSMPLMASVLLSTRRPIVVHPHYEHKETRDRAYAVYKVYGKFTPQELYEEMTKLKVTYLVIERNHCYGAYGKKCTLEKMWDAEAPMYAANPRLCHTLMTVPTDHFYRVFQNSQYDVFQIYDLSVRYMPRSFDS